MTAALRRPSTAVVAVAILLVGIFPLVSDDLYYQNMIILSLVFAIGAVGLNVIMGYGGYISLGQMLNTLSGGDGRTSTR